MRITRHAAARQTQRRIPDRMVRLIRDHARPVPSRGAVSLMLDDDTIDLIAEDDRHHRQRLRGFRGAYLIEGEDGRIVTVAWSRRRHRRR